jgi:glucose uptake protein GlcU
MNKFRLILGFCCIVFMVFHVFNMNFKDFNWDNNGGSILGIISMVLIMFSIYFSHRYDKRQKQ